MKKLIAISLALAILFCGCSMDMTGSVYEHHYYVDEDTGVNYIYINSDSGISMCPRYNADGTLYVSM